MWSSVFSLPLPLIHLLCSKHNELVAGSELQPDCWRVFSSWWLSGEMTQAKCHWLFSPSNLVSFSYLLPPYMEKLSLRMPNCLAFCVKVFEMGTEWPQLPCVPPHCLFNDRSCQVSQVLPHNCLLGVWWPDPQDFAILISYSIYSFAFRHKHLSGMSITLLLWHLPAWH